MNNKNASLQGNGSALTEGNNASNSVKKSASSFFEKHAFTSTTSNQQNQQQAHHTAFQPKGPTGNVVSKIPQTSTSSSYNMHR